MPAENPTTMSIGSALARLFVWIAGTWLGTGIRWVFRRFRRLGAWIAGSWLGTAFRWVFRPVRRLGAWMADRANWSMLGLVGNTRLLRTSFVWLILVPIAAKALGPVAGTYEWSSDGLNRVTEEFLQECPEPMGVRFAIRLPFSWITFYVMAVAFFLGELVYVAGCPRIVKAYRTYADYRSSHAGEQPLWTALGELFMTIPAGRFKRCVRDLGLCLWISDKEERSWRDEIIEQAIEQPTRDNRANVGAAFVTHLGRSHGDQILLSNTFELTRSHAAMLRPAWRVACALLFGVGFALLGVVMYQNGRTVYRIAAEQGVGFWQLLVGHG